VVNVHPSVVEAEFECAIASVVESGRDRDPRDVDRGASDVRQCWEPGDEATNFRPRDACLGVRREALDERRFVEKTARKRLPPRLEFRLQLVVRAEGRRRVIREKLRVRS